MYIESKNIGRCEIISRSTVGGEKDFGEFGTSERGGDDDGRWSKPVCTMDTTTRFTFYATHYNYVKTKLLLKKILCIALLKSGKYARKLVLHFPLGDPLLFQQPIMSCTVMSLTARGDRALLSSGPNGVDRCLTWTHHHPAPHSSSSTTTTHWTSCTIPPPPAATAASWKTSGTSILSSIQTTSAPWPPSSTITSSWRYSLSRLCGRSRRRSSDDTPHHVFHKKIVSWIHYSSIISSLTYLGVKNFILANSTLF